MRTRYAYAGTPGTTERGRTERARLDGLISSAGGLMAYMGGAKNPTLTDGARACYNEPDGTRRRRRE